MDKTIFTTLLSEMEDDNFNSLIDYQTLLQSGWKFYYIIDADLIGNYCFPEGFGDAADENSMRRKGRHISPEYIFDEQVTLHSLFNLPIQVEKEMLLQAYVNELRGMIHKAGIMASRPPVSTAISNQLNSLLTRLKAQTKNEPVNTDLIEEHFIQIIAAVLMRIDGLKKYNDLLDNGRFTYESMDLNNELLENACDFEKGSEQNERIIKSIHIDILKTGMTKSKIADVNAIDRTIGINNFIQQWGKGKERKHIFLFAVDAPTPQRVMDFIKKSNILPYPTFDGFRINLYRTTQEYFAYIICCVQNEDKTINHEKTLTNLRNLKEASRQYKRTKEMLAREAAYAGQEPLALPQGSQGEYAEIFNSYDRHMSALQNTGLGRSFDSIHKSIKKNLKDGTIADIKDYLDGIQREEKTMLQRIIRTHDEILDNILHEANFNRIFVDGIEILRKGNMELDFSKGADGVEGSYQHLPMFFAFEGNNSTKNNQDFLQITLLILQRKITPGSTLFEDLQQLLAQLHDRLFLIKSRSKYPLEEKLLKTLLYLILPMSGQGPLMSSRDKQSNDTEAYHWLNKIEGTAEDMGYLYREFLYLQCWVARRVGDFDGAKIIAVKGIELYKDDPRFYHGLFLAEYCHFLTGKPKEKQLERINFILEHTEHADARYPLFIEKHYDSQIAINLKARLRDCFGNNFCYFLTEKAKLLAEIKAIPEAIESLEQAEQRLGKMMQKGHFLEPLAEYYDTAANLYWAQSYYPDKYDIKEKAEAALNYIDQAVILAPRREIRIEYETKKHNIAIRHQEVTRKP